MKTVFIAMASLLLFCACRKDVAELQYNDYPREQGRLFINRCAVSGCHNQQSAAACAGLDLSSWQALSKGGRNNSAVIPFRADQSYLLFSVNTFTDLGIPHLHPLMPLTGTKLSRDEVLALRDWINEGARNSRGQAMHEDKAQGRKIFVASQGCDLVSVFDAGSRVLMRVFDVGNAANTEAPHDMLVSPDGKYLYISFYNGNLIQKLSTIDYTKLAELQFADYSWHAMSVSGDSRYALASHLGASGKVKLIDLQDMKELATFVLAYSHGCAMNQDGSTAYVTSQQGNFIYKLNLSDPGNYSATEIPLQPGSAPQIIGAHKPYAVSYFPDFSKYAVTCQGTREVRVFDAGNDSLLSVINTGGVPQLMSFSTRYPYLFVSCMSDSANQSSSSTISVINYNSFQLVKNIFSGHQPRGLPVDDNASTVWIANRNISPVGWEPHHSTNCAGRNGYITLIDMQRLTLVEGWRTEVSVDPYSVALKP